MEMDILDKVISSCLSQLDKLGQLRLVVYYSRKLMEVELNYDVYNKEMLAIVECFRTWRHYLEGAYHQVKVITDHKNLTYFMTTKVLNRRQVRWAEALAAFDFRIQYRKGNENARADALSRQKTFDKVKEKPRAILKQTEEGIVYNHEEMYATLARIEDSSWEEKFKEAYETDIWAQRVLQEVPKNFMIDERNIIRFQGMVYVPKVCRKDFVLQQHALPTWGHQGVTGTWERISRDYYFPSMQSYIAK